MKIVVGYLWAAPPKEATVLADGRVTWPGVRRIVGESERVAIEFAKTVAEATASTLIGITVGDATTAVPAAASAGLACGLDEAVVVCTPQPPETATTAAAFAAAVAELGDVDLVVLGHAASDSGTRLLPGYLAGLLGWPVLTDVSDAGFDEQGLWAENEKLHLRRRYRVASPAVVAVSAAARTPRQMGLRDIMAAGSKPSRLVTAGDVGAIDPFPFAVVGSSELPTSTRGGRRIVASDPQLAAHQLVGELRAKGVL